jgi:hypothetical protein
LLSQVPSWVARLNADLQAPEPGVGDDRAVNALHEVLA